MNALSKHKKSEIILLARRGYSLREISRRLNIGRRTVSKYTREAGIQPDRSPHSKRPILTKESLGLTRTQGRTL